MPTWNDLEQTLTRHLKLDRPPVAVTFCDAVPAGVRKFEGSVPSGCTFWKVAATAPPRQGAFYTVAADHQNCPIGAHTHDDNVYLMVRGTDLERVTEALEPIMNANEQLTIFHQARRAGLTAGDAARA